MELKSAVLKNAVSYQNKSLVWFSVIWSFVILAPLIYFPNSSVLTGHPWKVELVISLILSIFFIRSILKKSNQGLNASLHTAILRRIILPLTALILWSALSALWAGSLLSVAHHTLVWSIYLIFFLCSLIITQNSKLLKMSLLSFSCVIGIIALLCVIEFTFSEQIGETFGFRYARFAEIHAAALPLFFSFILRFKRKYLYGAVILTLITWLAIFFSMSRGAFLSSIAGLSVFVILRLCAKKSVVEKRRLIIVPIGIILIAIISQFLLFNSTEQKGTAFSRLVTQKSDDQNNSFSTNVRFLISGVALEMFTRNKLIGIGADNFGLEFNKYRALFSAREENKKTANRQEELIPERAHNEYLQILAELGIIGAIFLSLFIFGIFKFAFNEITKNNSRRSNILSHAAIAGIIAFLISSLFSSFSFRLMQNGIVFFFLLSLLLRNFLITEKSELVINIFKPRLKNFLAALAIILSFSLFIFSFCKASSQYIVYVAEIEPDSALAEALYKNAKRIDPANAAADFCYGMRLLKENKYRESAQELRQAIDKGLNSSISYSYLATAQILSGDNQSAESTLAEAVKIFSSSTFIRVRYSSILKKTGNQLESEKQFDIARRINVKQAETWQDLIDNGVRVTNQKYNSDLNLIDINQLYPNQAVYAILNERQITNPQEKFNFNLSNW